MRTPRAERSSVRRGCRFLRCGEWPAAQRGQHPARVARWKGSKPAGSRRFRAAERSIGWSYESPRARRRRVGLRVQRNEIDDTPPDRELRETGSRHAQRVQRAELLVKVDDGAPPRGAWTRARTQRRAASCARVRRGQAAGRCARSSIPGPPFARAGPAPRGANVQSMP